MGVKNLWEILESCKKTLPLHHLQNKRVCIDLSCWMVQLISVNRSHCAMRDKVYLKGLFHRLRALIALNCTLIFVTDGSIPAIKVATYRRRLNSDNQAAQDDTSSHELTSLRRNMGSDFSCMIKEAKVLGMALGIPCLDGIEEGEAQCGLLNSESLCDGCFSSDSDIFLFGARTVYRDICLGEGGYVVCYEMADIERKLGYGRNSLITLGVLLGSDYSHGVHGLGRDSACQIVKAAGDSTVLQRIASEGMSFAKKSKFSKKQAQVLKSKENCSDNVLNINGSNQNTQADDLFLQVIEAYLKPKCHPADSQAVRRVLGIYPFQRSRLQQTCAEFFGWPSEKTDEYILPKVAERDLRRFANLRSTSSDLGVRLPLDQMPVKCPVSGIIKPRKVLGKDAFEVSWEDFDGLGTSIVPADLIESACPEKIVEFEEKKAQGKKKSKQQRRPKKSDKTETALHLIDEKLQELLLDIEHENHAAFTKSRSALQVGPQNQYQLRDQNNTYGKSSSNTEHNAALTKSSRPLEGGPKNQKSVGPSSTESDLKSPLNLELLHNAEGNRSYEKSAGPSFTVPEVIDLLSPSPLIRKQGVPKCREEIVECVDVIDLSESEAEVSPGHAEKSRELRLFLANIRRDIS